jgi:hypothetical protein
VKAYLEAVMGCLECRGRRTVDAQEGVRRRGAAPGREVATGAGRLERLKIAVPVPVGCGKPVEIPEVDANFPEVRKGFCNYSGSTSGKQLLYIYIFIEYSGGTGGRMGNLYVCEETITLRRRCGERY